MTRTTMTTSLIDPPSPFDRMEEWQRYFHMLQQLPETHVLKAALIREAQVTIQRKRGSASPDGAHANR